MSRNNEIYHIYQITVKTNNTEVTSYHTGIDTQVPTADRFFNKIMRVFTAPSAAVEGNGFAIYPYVKQYGVINVTVNKIVDSVSREIAFNTKKHLATVDSRCVSTKTNRGRFNLEVALD
jgi:hypothetical protein